MRLRSEEDGAVSDEREVCVGDRLIDGRRAVGGLLARIVRTMSSEEFDQWRLGRMLDRNYLRNRYAVGGHRDQ